MFRLRPVSSIAPAAAGSPIGGAAHATAGATTSAKPATMNPACRVMRFIADLLGACRALSHGNAHWGSKEHTTTATSLAILSLRTYDAEKSGSRVERL